jgi:hypothetical protein
MAAILRTGLPQPHSSPTGSEVLDYPRDFTMHSERNFGPGGVLDLALSRRNSGISAAVDDISLRGGLSCSPPNATSLRDCSPNGSPRGSPTGADDSLSAQAQLSAPLSSPPCCPSLAVAVSPDASHPDSLVKSRFSRSREAVSPVEVSPREAAGKGGV